MTTVAESGEQVQSEKDELISSKLHPLQDAGLWDECINKVATFHSVEHFWSVMLHTEPPTAIANGTDVYMFRADIQPKWEDPRNVNGGRWLILLAQNDPIDTYWEELLMLLVGSDWDTNEEAEQICGAAFQPRARGNKLAVWLANKDDETTIRSIGERIKERLNYTRNIYFQSVEDQKSVTRGRDAEHGSMVL